MAEIRDITPLHNPVGLAKDMLEEAPGKVAGIAVLVGEDGELWYDMAGNKRLYLCWGLTKLLHRLMEESNDQI